MGVRVGRGVCDKVRLVADAVIRISILCALRASARENNLPEVIVAKRVCIPRSRARIRVGHCTNVGGEH